MRKKVKDEEIQAELVMAIGLVWGHLNARQFEEAYSLAKGCMRIWPGDRSLALMSAYAAAELLEPVDERKLAGLRDPACEDWIRLVLRRAEKRVEQSAEPEDA
ncbi:MAG: hypothetical protein V7642_1766 [Burkholderiales bacterium]|jgi:hypothetical protein